jgi:hypothetical protein
VYSHVRNEVLTLGKQAPIRSFLAAACPVMSIVAPEQYLAACGWSLVGVELLRDDGAELRLQHLRKTTPCLNGFDLLRRCLAGGYEVYNSEEVLSRMMQRQEHLMTKAFATDADAASQSPHLTTASDASSQPHLMSASPDNLSQQAVYGDSSYKPSPASDFFTSNIDQPSPVSSTPQGGHIMRLDETGSTDNYESHSHDMINRLDGSSADSYPDYGLLPDDELARQLCEMSAEAKRLHGAEGDATHDHFYDGEFGDAYMDFGSG